MIDAADLELLRESQADKSRFVDLIVTGCAYACCGRPWARRDGYEQGYCGWIDNLDDGTFMLYSPGLGTVSYVVAVRFDEVVGVNLREPVA